MNLEDPHSRLGPWISIRFFLEHSQDMSSLNFFKRTSPVQT